MSAPQPAVLRTLVAGVVVVLAGVACWALYAVQSGRERHAYAHGGSPPEYVHLASGHTYWLAVPGGVKQLDKLGVQVSALQCTATRPGQSPGALSLAPERTDTKAIDQIASFFSRISGTVHIECTGLGTVYVDGGSDGFDWSGLWLILASAALAIGIPLTLSGRRGLPPRPVAPRRARDQGDDDEAEDDDADDFEPSGLFGNDDR